MRTDSPLYYILLLVFAAVATSSIVLQNVLWAAILVWGFETFRKKHPIRWPRDAFSYVTLVFLVSFLIGALMGINPSDSLKTVHKYLILLAFFPLAAMSLDFTRTQRLMTYFTVGAAFCAAYGIAKYGLGVEERIRSFSGHYMVFGGLLMTALLVQVHRLLQRPRSWVQWTLLLLLAAGLALTRTRGAWLGFSAGFVWLAFKTERRLLSYGAAAVLVGFLLSPAPIKERVKSLLDSRLSYSNMERVYMWQAGWKISHDRPIFGIGQGNLEKVYPDYRMPGAQEAVIGHMHNNFMQLLVQNGWVGLLAYLAWIVFYFREVRFFKPRHPAERRLNGMFTAVFISILVWGLTEYTFSHQFMMVQVFLLGLQFGMMDKARTNDKA